MSERLRFDADLREDDIDVLAVNLDDELLMISILGSTGLLKIDRFLGPDGEEEAPKEVATYAEFQLNGKVFTIPLASNVGEAIGIAAEPN